MIFREYMQQVNDDVLLKAFEELQELQQSGVLSEGEVKKFRRKYKELYSCADASISIIENEVYFEMAMRYYKKMEGVLA